jgi:hypothetical protein
MQSIPLGETPYLGLASIPTFFHWGRNFHASGKLTIPTCPPQSYYLGQIRCLPEACFNLSRLWETEAVRKMFVVIRMAGQYRMYIAEV